MAGKSHPVAALAALAVLGVVLVRPSGSHDPAPHAAAAAESSAAASPAARPAAAAVRRSAPGKALTLPAGMPQLVAAARSTRARYGVPVSVTLAQALHESGNGRSGLARRFNNLYGVKCGGQSQAGTNATGCATLPTEECLPACGRTAASFRTYASWQDSVADYGRILATLPAYRPAFGHRADPVAFARAVAGGGYATDPAYAAKLAVRVAQLRRYDR